MTDNTQNKTMSWSEFYATPKQAPVPAAKETPAWVTDWDMQQMRQRDPKRYRQQVWLQFRREVDPNATLADLPEELK